MSDEHELDDEAPPEIPDISSSPPPPPSEGVGDELEDDIDAVLKAPEIPSVLIELGYLSNPDDEKLMTDEEWQKAATARIADAVLKFFEPRLR